MVYSIKCHLISYFFIRTIRKLHISLAVKLQRFQVLEAQLGQLGHKSTLQERCGAGSLWCGDQFGEWPPGLLWGFVHGCSLVIGGGGTIWVVCSMEKFIGRSVKIWTRWKLCFWSRSAEGWRLYGWNNLSVYELHRGSGHAPSSGGKAVWRFKGHSLPSTAVWIHKGFQVV